MAKTQPASDCPDCPDLALSPDRPADYKPRAICCRDEHIDRRVTGDPREWTGTAEARERSQRDRDRNRPVMGKAEPTRQERRQRKRKR
jgi:hypothetical protein